MSWLSSLFRVTEAMIVCTKMKPSRTVTAREVQAPVRVTRQEDREEAAQHHNEQWYDEIRDIISTVPFHY